MQVTACRTYHSRTDRVELLRLPDGISAFKVYYISIIGRDTPEKFEWPQSAFTMHDFCARFRDSGIEGVGFVTAFPHITKVFRFAPAMETVLHVRAFDTPHLAPLDLARNEAYTEFACYAEAAIAADEYHAWARAATVEDYLATRSDFTDGPILDHTKLGRYVRA